MTSTSLNVSFTGRPIAVARAACATVRSDWRLHQIKLGIRELHFLPSQIDFRDASHLEECLNLLQVLGLVAHRSLPDLDQLLGRQHAEIGISHVEQNLLVDAIAILLRLRQLRATALHRSAGQTEIVDVLREVESSVVIRRVRPGLAVREQAERGGRSTRRRCVVVSLLVVRGAETQVWEIRRAALFEVRLGDVNLRFGGRQVGLVVAGLLVTIGKRE